MHQNSSPLLSCRSCSIDTGVQHTCKVKPRCGLLCIRLCLLVCQLQLTAAQQAAYDANQPDTNVAPISWRSCNSEQQVINCGIIPLTRAYRAERRACCKLYQPTRLSPAVQTAAAVAAVQRAAIGAATTRTDLAGQDYRAQPNSAALQPNNLTSSTANIPTFSLASNGAYTNVAVATYTVPELTKAVIQQVKNASLFSAAVPEEVRTYYNSIHKVNTVPQYGAAFNHPGSGAGAAELALLRYRLNAGAPVQVAAADSLVNGTGVKPTTKVSAQGTWAPPTDCKPTGFNAPGMTCPANYPSTAPHDTCGHVSFVESDGQMAYKMALAFHATGDTRYSGKVLQIVTAWSSNNTKWGLHYENGPLEAGWGVAAMARALELVRHKAPSGLIQKFTTWVFGPPYTSNIIYNMEYFLNLTKVQNRPNTYNNWHSTLAEAYMAVGVLSDNIAIYNRGVAIFNYTLPDYLKWGKGAYANGRLLGESSETLRDLYHTQYGLGGLIQAAEIAWQQDDASLYARDNFALAAAMEMHARITNAFAAGKSASMLPQNFRYYDASSFPKPPTDTTWKFNMETQLWSAYWTANGTYAGVDLKTNLKYLLGIGFLPTGWEMGYNHYAGRLGMPMPETAALLAANWPEWQDFHWGLGTLSHAQSATALWRSGLIQNTLSNRPDGGTSPNNGAQTGPDDSSQSGSNASSQTAPTSSPAPQGETETNETDATSSNGSGMNGTSSLPLCLVNCGFNQTKIKSGAGSAASSCAWLLLCMLLVVDAVL